jgi:hypothetical protein
MKINIPFIAMRRLTMALRSLLFSAAILLTLTACGGGGGGGGGDNDIAKADSDGDGLIDIFTLQQLDWMRNDLSGASRHDGVSGDSSGCPPAGCNGYELMADLDFDTNASGTADSGDSYYDYDGDLSNNGWLPIGTMAAPFLADFAGNYHSISNLYIDRTNADAETAGNDIGLFGYVGDGFTRTDFTNLELSGNATLISGGKDVAALVGYGSSVFFDNITVAATVTGTGTNVGGLVGHLQQGRITNINNDSAISGNVAGGVAGKITSGDSFFNISNCNSAGTVTGGGTAGGLIGSYSDISTFASNNTVTIKDNFVTTAVSGTSYLGGLIGAVRGDAELNLGLQIDSNSSGGSVTGTGNYIGGMIGEASTNIIIRDSVANGSVAGGSFAGGLVGQAIGDVTIVNSRGNGNVSGANRVGGLIGYADSGANFILVNNSNAIGDVTSTAGQGTGGLIGWAEVDVRVWSSRATGDVTSTGDYIGGLIGLARRGPFQILDSYSTGTVSGANYVGGLIGSLNFISSTISANGGTVETSFSTSAVTGQNYVGGLIGLSYNVSHQNTFATGDVTGTIYVGGLIGDINETYNVAALVNSYSTGTVTGTTSRGGLIGYNNGASYTSNYFATDNSGQANAFGTNNSAGGLNPPGTQGDTLADLKAAVTPGEVIGGTPLYVGWSDASWAFPANLQLPGLILGGLIYRDADGDGTLD